MTFTSTRAPALTSTGEWVGAWACGPRKRYGNESLCKDVAVGVEKRQSLRAQVSGIPAPRRRRRSPKRSLPPRKPNPSGAATVCQSSDSTRRRPRRTLPSKFHRQGAVRTRQHYHPGTQMHPQTPPLRERRVRDAFGNNPRPGQNQPTCAQISSRTARSKRQTQQLKPPRLPGGSLDEPL